jgi:mannose-6-phosphate isomerase
MESDLPHYMRDERPWGKFERFTLNDPSTVKLLHVRAGEAFSLQTHEHRDEFWRVLTGEGVLTVGQEQCPARAGENHFIPRGTAHRAQAGATDLWLLEISFGDFDEEDIVRLEDKYGRA